MTEHGGDGEPRRRPPRRRRRGGAAQGRPALATCSVADLVAQDVRGAAPSGAASPAAPAARVRPAQRPHRHLPHARRLQRRDEGARRRRTRASSSCSRCPNKTWRARTSSASRSPRTSTRDDGKPGVLQHGRPPRPRVAGRRARRWSGRYELVNGYKAGDARATNDRARAAATSSCRSSTPTASRPPAPPARSPAGDGGRDEAVDDTVYLVAGAADRRRVPAQELPRCPTTPTAGNCATSAGLAEPGVDPNRNYGGLWGGPGADDRPGDADLPRSRPVLRARDAQRPGARLRQPGDDADHQPHDGGARPARARPGRRSATPSTRTGLQGARRRDGQGERLLLPEDLRALRHDRHDRGLELQRHGRLRLHVRDLLRRAQLRDGRLRRPGLPPDATQRGVERSGTATNPTSPTTPTTPARTRATTARATARRTTSPPRATLNEERHSVLEGTAPAGATLRLTQDVQDGDLPAAGRGRRSRSSSTTSSRRSTTSATTASSAGTSTRRRGRSSPRTAARRAPARRARRRRTTAARRLLGDRRRPATTARPPERRRRTPTTRSTTTTTRSRSRRRGDNEIDERPRRVGDAGERLRHRALRGRQRRRPLAERRARGRHRARRGRRTSEEVVGGAPGAGAGQEVRAAGEQLRRGRAVHGDDHLHRAAPVQARPGRELHAHLRARRSGVRPPSRSRSTAARSRRSTCARARPRAGRRAPRTRSGCAPSAPSAAAAAYGSGSAATRGARCGSTSSRSRTGGA